MGEMKWNPKLLIELINATWNQPKQGHNPAYSTENSAETSCHFLIQYPANLP